MGSVVIYTLNNKSSLITILPFSFLVDEDISLLDGYQFNFWGKYILIRIHLTNPLPNYGSSMATSSIFEGKSILIRIRWQIHYQTTVVPWLPVQFLRKIHLNTNSFDKSTTKLRQIHLTNLLQNYGSCLNSNSFDKSVYNCLQLQIVYNCLQLICLHCNSNNDVI